ncbi:unnamed protein product [Polarella glacialis]|nr:unnamed protein product [Polarella glacialis]
MPGDAERDGDWERSGKWLSFYNGSHAPHLPEVVGSVELLPWRSCAPASQLVSFVGQGLLGPAGPLRCLELGCGTGENLPLLAQHASFVCGVDIAPQAVAHARAALDLAGCAEPNAQVLVADVLRLGLPGSDCPELLADGRGWGGDFDFVFDCQCLHCLFHVDKAAVASLPARLLRPGGRLLLLTGSADEPTDRGPVRLTREQVMEIFAGSGLLCEELQATRFDWTSTYRGQEGFSEPPLGWMSIWRNLDVQL